MTSRVPPGSRFPCGGRCLLQLKFPLGVQAPGFSLYPSYSEQKAQLRQWQPHLSSPKPVFINPFGIFSIAPAAASCSGELWAGSLIGEPIDEHWQMATGLLVEPLGRQPFPFHGSTMQRKTTASTWSHYINQLSGAIDSDHLPLRTLLSLRRKKGTRVYC